MQGEAAACLAVIRNTQRQRRTLYHINQLALLRISNPFAPAIAYLIVFWSCMQRLIISLCKVDSTWILPQTNKQTNKQQTKITIIC